MQIVANNLRFSYGKSDKNIKVVALDDVSVEIPEGSFYGIVGHTGSGKSTFIQHLNGLIKVQKDSGRLIVGDYDLTDKNCDYKSLRSKVGMVFQYPEYQLFAETVFLDVAFGLKNFFPNLTEKEVEDKVRYALEVVGLDYEKIKDCSPFELSGGQKRRVAIAGVIVSKPEVLVLDEPASGLDPVGKREFIATLHRLHGDFCKTIVIVSHDMNLVSENCDLCSVFKKGKIIKTGTPKEIFGDLELIKSVGLDFPATAFLTNKLKEKGVIIDSSLTVDDFVSCVSKYYLSRGNKQ